METINRTAPKARKEHVCDWCNEKINVGEIYTRAFCKEDDVYVWRNHTRCEKIAEKLKMFNDVAVSQDVFFETIREEYIRIMEIHHSEVFNYEYFEYPSFKEQLDFVCSFHNL